MARLLPEKVKIFHNENTTAPAYSFYWQGEDEERGFEPCVLETEWLYVMHLVEQTLTAAQEADYVEELAGTIMEGVYDATDKHYFHSKLCAKELIYRATFNQRATAMCKVKGITV